MTAHILEALDAALKSICEKEVQTAREEFKQENESLRAQCQEALARNEQLLAEQKAETEKTLSETKKQVEAAIADVATKVADNEERVSAQIAEVTSTSKERMESVQQDVLSEISALIEEKCMTTQDELRGKQEELAKEVQQKASQEDLTSATASAEAKLSGLERRVDEDAKRAEERVSVLSAEMTTSLKSFASLDALEAAVKDATHKIDEEQAEKLLALGEAAKEATQKLEEEQKERLSLIDSTFSEKLASVKMDVNSLCVKAQEQSELAVENAKSELTQRFDELCADHVSSQEANKKSMEDMDAGQEVMRKGLGAVQLIVDTLASNDALHAHAENMQSKVDELLKSMEGKANRDIVASQQDLDKLKELVDTKADTVVVADQKKAFDEKVLLIDQELEEKAPRDLVESINDAINDRVSEPALEDILAPVRDCISAVQQEICKTQKVVSTATDKFDSFEERALSVESKFDEKIAEVEAVMTHQATALRGEVEAQSEQQREDLQKAKDVIEADIKEMHCAIDGCITSEMLQEVKLSVDASLANVQNNLASSVKASDLDGLRDDLREHVRKSDLEGAVKSINDTISMVEKDIGKAVSKEQFERVVASWNEQVTETVTHLEQQSEQHKNVCMEAIKREVSAAQRFETGEIAVEIEMTRKELEEMREQWLRLGGHMNPQQRIQHVADVKMENNQLRDELMHTRKQLHSACVGTPGTDRKAPAPTPRKSTGQRGGC